MAWREVGAKMAKIRGLIEIAVKLVVLPYGTEVL
jgi:hypothetical protein